MTNLATDPGRGVSPEAFRLSRENFARVAAFPGGEPTPPALTLASDLSWQQHLQRRFWKDMALCRSTGGLCPYMIHD